MKEVVLRLISMNAAAMLNGVDDDETDKQGVLCEMVGEEWVLSLLEGVSAEALEAFRHKHILKQSHLVEISKLFDKVGVENHLRELLAVMVPGHDGYDPRVDENVRLPRAVLEPDSFGSEAELKELVEVGAMGWIEWFLNRHDHLRRRVCQVAARVGNLEVLRWARGEGCPWTEHAASSAALGGHLKVLTWARHHGCPWDAFTCSQAAVGGHLDVLKWARAGGCPWTEHACSCAALGGHLDILKWARHHGCPWDAFTCSQAAVGGNLEVLKYARAHGCDWTSRTCAWAARSGHLAILKWARANGCPWDDYTCVQAACFGHLEVLKWARGHGCPWSEETCALAARGGHLEVLKWARGHGGVRGARRRVLRARRRAGTSRSYGG
ncbi:hypothetical protein CTAYLR_006194 [Chrysophaeum taylorii]|uniref:Ankyrin repeat protein n=1 Tax=Chrysophaeum taylorii TaxID=2483200 RepID=A0AAD7XRD2_9STRA|nr:hypothetical protein CTAYLR_006194 [Chrysophaeum taylorii]